MPIPALKKGSGDTFAGLACDGAIGLLARNSEEGNPGIALAVFDAGFDVCVGSVDEFA